MLVCPFPTPEKRGVLGHSPFAQEGPYLARGDKTSTLGIYRHGWTSVRVTLGRFIRDPLWDPLMPGSLFLSLSLTSKESTPTSECEYDVPSLPRLEPLSPWLASREHATLPEEVVVGGRRGPPRGHWWAPKAMVPRKLHLTLLTVHPPQACGLSPP